jgi:hypothetical protein
MEHSSEHAGSAGEIVDPAIAVHTILGRLNLPTILAEALEARENPRCCNRAMLGQ